MVRTGAGTQSLILAIGRKNTGKCAKGGFDFILFSKARFPGRRRALLSASPQDIWTTAPTAVLGVPSKRVIRAGNHRQQGQHCRGE